MAQINLKVATLADLEFYNKLRNDVDNAVALNWQEFNRPICRRNRARHAVYWRGNRNEQCFSCRQAWIVFEA